MLVVDFSDEGVCFGILVENEADLSEMSEELPEFLEGRDCEVNGRGSTGNEVLGLERRRLEGEEGVVLESEFEAVQSGCENPLVHFLAANSLFILFFLLRSHSLLLLITRIALLSFFPL